MDSEEKLQILRDVHDVDWSTMDEPVAADLVRFTGGVIADSAPTWYDNAPFIDRLMDEFSDDHEIWDFITLD